VVFNFVHQAFTYGVAKPRQLLFTLAWSIDHLQALTLDDVRPQVDPLSQLTHVTVVTRVDVKLPRTRHGMTLSASSANGLPLISGNL